MIVSRLTPFGANPEIWRIDQPVVNAPQTPITEISLNPGDAISFDAGGCVQTGGVGLTWKRYVNPSGRNSDALYHGTILLPGWFNADCNSNPDSGGSLIPIRISSFVPNRTQYVVPPGASGYLTIGYEDDHYLDNGYDSHDNGTEDQCKGCGDAWIIVTVTHPYLYQNHFYNRKRKRGTKEHDYLTPDTPGLPVMSAGSHQHSAEPAAVLSPDGVTLETESNGPTLGLASRTVYLVSNVLAGAGFLRAELEFDMPSGPVDKKTAGAVWAVALNFKNGDETDRDSDTKIGFTCQFVDNGQAVRFHFTDGPDKVDLSDLPAIGYAAFATQQTVFKLIVQVCRDDHDATAGYAELYINGAFRNRGKLRVQAPTLAQTLADPSLITAAGFALVSGDGYEVMARFRSFTLQYQYGPCVSRNPRSVSQPPIVYNGL